jgi:hypothetical protein
MTRGVLAAALLALAGCVTAPAVDPSFKLRPETRSECVTHCQTLGMRLGAVVLVRNSAGCVCEEIRSEPRAAGGGAAVSAGAYLVALEEEAARQQQQQNAQHHSGTPTSPPPHVAPGHR